MKRFLQHNFLILVLLNSGNLFNYLFQFLVGRSLTPDDFGTFNALNSLSVLASAPMVVIPLVLSRFTISLGVQNPAALRSLLTTSLRWLGLAALCVFVLGTFLLPGIRSYLHVEDSTPVLLMLALTSLSFIMPVPLGMLMGLQRFTGFGLGSCMSSVGRFLAALALVALLGHGVGGALVSGIVGVGASLALALFFLRDVASGPSEPLPKGMLREVGWYTLPVLVNAALLMALGNLDLVLARHYCPADASGHYAMAAVLGRIAYYLPSALLMVLFPEVTKSHESGEDSVRTLWLSMGMTLALGGGFALVCGLWPEPVISLLFGANYLDSAPALRMVVAAMALMAAANVFFTYCLACSLYGYLWILGTGLAGMISLISFFHASPEEIAGCLLASSAAILAATACWFLVVGMKAESRRRIVLKSRTIEQAP
ncbi:O-antigen/teichoic acid export membrane protein [Desulfobaculum xiamenense]|uniref:O-antigen/teichoic acid export membrane protein n=1 Tax=Desulfobaculum xiamenense TaxID=995050 RepID=A0A846QQ94_9BACT|nr:oligosaccharide flippase family protein [Desulfobaculum xiamenense]NJB68672.1 O-antigen/teichoic acid export membrane protein [Desulfobaculum xiamenense]